MRESLLCEFHFADVTIIFSEKKRKKEMSHSQSQESYVQPINPFVVEKHAINLYQRLDDHSVDSVIKNFSKDDSIEYSLRFPNTIERNLFMRRIAEPSEKLIVVDGSLNTPILVELVTDFEHLKNTTVLIISDKISQSDKIFYETINNNFRKWSLKKSSDEKFSSSSSSFSTSITDTCTPARDMERLIDSNSCVAPTSSSSSSPPLSSFNSMSEFISQNQKNNQPNMKKSGLPKDLMSLFGLSEEHTFKSFNIVGDVTFASPLTQKLEKAKLSVNLSVE